MESSIRSYCDEWHFLFENGPTEHLKQLCLQGKLQGSHFRSVCWKILLGCLSSDKSKWLEHTNVSRQSFSNLKLKYDVDPRKLKDSKSDLGTNNPLSQQNNSPWQQYFMDVELKSCIRQDVERTFPELAYFQSNDVREMMIDILFVYARENPHISYKQGMHEILGPLIFVLYSDQQSLSHALEQHEFSTDSDAARRRLICTLINCKYLEHDAFQMFTYIMQIIQPWYHYGTDTQESERNQIILEPFCRPQDSGPTSALIKKLNWIGDRLLQGNDAILFNHLEKLEIPPQIYGIRWLRLLFGREFPIQDLLFLWDAIFASGQPFLLVDHIFVAMLIFIRDLLLSCDYTGCLHYLMRYPPVTDVNSLLALALHIQDPKKYIKPKFVSPTNFSHITVAGRPHPNMPTHRFVDAQGDRQVLPSNGTGSEFLKTMENFADLRFKSKGFFNEAQNNSTLINAKGVPPNRNRSESFKKHPKHLSVKQRSVVTEEELDLLKEQVSCLQVRLNEVEGENRNASRKLKLLIDQLETRLISISIPSSDESINLLGEMRRILQNFERISKSEEKFRKAENSSSYAVRHRNSLTSMEPVHGPIEIGNDPTLSMKSPTKDIKTAPKFKPEIKSTRPKVVLNAENEMQIISNNSS